MRQAKKLKRLKSILVSKTYYIFFYLHLLTYSLVMTANAVVLLSKPREKLKNNKTKNLLTSSLQYRRILGRRRLLVYARTVVTAIFIMTEED